MKINKLEAAEKQNDFKPDVIARQLAHAERDQIRAAYNHAEYLKERREMMDWWGNFVGKCVENKTLSNKEH